ncbi:hypothetical protein ACJX0J_027314 [Zea mays]
MTLKWLRLNNLLIVDLLDSESEKEKLLTLLEFDQRCRFLSDALFNSIIEMHGLIELDLSDRSNPTFEKLDRFLLEVRIILIFGNKNESTNLSDEEKDENKLQEKKIIHSLLDNGILVDNEDGINKLDDRKFLTAPFSLDEIHKNFFRIFGILLKGIFGTCNQFGFTNGKKSDCWTIYNLQGT